MHRLCIKVGKKLGLGDAMIDELALLAVLHDIGKIAIPDHVLNKPDKLTEEEWKTMKTHSEIGFRIASESPDLSHIAYSILTHHENYDGTGYPKGLKGKEIPIISRIISILDAYDVMTHDRPYKKAIETEAAILEIRRCSGTQFDPDLIELCIAVFSNN
jgi:HD-GYP domain-containing protein (c-di-GMP phosphodiesterase class II)